MEGTQLGAIMLPHLNQQSTFRNRTGQASTSCTAIRLQQLLHTRLARYSAHQRHRAVARVDAQVYP